MTPENQCIVNLDYVPGGGESLYMHQIMKELIQIPEFAELVDVEYHEYKDQPIVYLYRGDKQVLVAPYQNYTA